MMILDEICAKKKLRVAQRKQTVSLAEMQKRAARVSRVPVDFASALLEPGLSVIAEVKKASPSKGVIRPDFDPVSIARAYIQAGVQAMSVLTEEDYFQGSDGYLRQIRALTDIPLLRKDFIVDEYQIYEALTLGADAILLIAAMLERETMERYYRLARELGLYVLTESHNEDELKKVLEIGMPIVGVNNRNLHDFTEDITTTERLARLVPADRILVSESAIRTPADFARVRKYGADAVLVGEAFMRNPDVGKAVARLREGV